MRDLSHSDRLKKLAIPLGLIILILLLTSFKYTNIKLIDYSIKTLLIFFFMRITLNILIYHMSKETFNLSRDKNFIFKYLFKSVYHNLKNYKTLQTQLVDEKTKSTKELERLTKINNTILKISTKAIEIHEREKMIKYILKKAIDIIDNAHKGSFLAIDDEKYFQPIASIGYKHEILKKIRLSLDETFYKGRDKSHINLPMVIKNLSDFNVSTLDNERFKLLKDADGLNVKTTLSCPVFINNEMYGILNIDSHSEDAFTSEDALLIKHFVIQIEILIKNYEIAKEKLYFSRHDGLTGLYNRHYFEELLSESHKKSLKYNNDFILVVFDLDDFKKINDLYGHAIGDRAIKEFAKELENSFRKSDLVARYGGDEFIGVFFNSREDQIKKRIDDLKSKFIKEPITLKDKEKITIKFSYGMALFPKDSYDLEELFKIADKRMYDDKLMRKKVII